MKNNILECRFKYKKGWDQWVLLMSDEHFDSKYCDRKLLKKHHDQAIERNALIFKFGDIFDCMGGKYDKRTNKEDLRPEYQKANYFDVITDDAADFYRPYAKNIKMISYGNHELAVLKRHETDLIKNLSEKADIKNVGDYTGWIRFMFEDKYGSGVRTKTLYYTHGAGGNSPVTKGVISTNRRSVQVDADFFVNGHNHNSWEMVITRKKLSNNGEERQYAQHHWNLGTYKDSSEWEVNSGFPPPAKMARWLRFYVFSKEIYVESFLAT